MHVWFRQHAQQMGMQNVRAILPEQIDLLINTSITDTINELIRSNIGITNDRIITDNSKIGQINAFRTLYKVIEVNATPGNSASSSATPFKKEDETFIQRQSALIKNFGNNGNFDYLFLVDLSLNYNRDGGGSQTAITTNYFPVRIIEDSFLSDTLNDFILRPRLRTPIAVVYNDTLDLYIDVLNNGNLPENLKPNKLRVSYIGKPAVVKYAQDIGGSNIDCDLPEFMHIDILKHAVDLWRIAISGSLSASQNQDRVAQQENYRNNYRNEGYPNANQ